MSIDLSTYGGRVRDLGYAGDLLDMGPSDVISMMNSAVQTILPGGVIARDAGAINAGPGATCKAPTADGDVPIGFAKRYPMRPADYSTDAVTYKQYDEIPVIRKGYVLCLAAENATKGDGVISITAGHGTVGSTTGGAAGAGRVAVPGATWETTTAAGQIGIVKILN